MTVREPSKLIPTTFVTVPSVAWLKKLSFTASTKPGTVDAVIYLATSQSKLTETEIAPQAKAAGFEGKPMQVVSIASAKGPQVFVVGLGDAKDLSTAQLRDAGAAGARAASRHASLAFVPVGLTLDKVKISAAEASAAVAEGAALARYRYGQLQSKDTSTQLVKVVTTFGTGAAVTKALDEAKLHVRAACVTRDLANTPPGHLTAVNFADAAVQLGKTYGFKVELFDKKALIKMKMGGILGVNQGSSEEPRMIKLSWKGTGKKHVAFVGKGIMYDSGGINLKPSDPMHLLMKMDMAGAAALLGMFSAARDAKVASSMTAYLMATDNMPSGSAYKMGDVLHARNGKTVEVRNTDAEGRLAMMDGLVLAAESKPDAIVDIATLTGNILLALGEHIGGLFSNNDSVAAQLESAARSTDENVWRMPMWRRYRKQLDSQIADLGNVGGRYGGAIQAALFLEEFVDGTPWAHLDIAGTMQTEKDDSWRPAGATGYGARLLLSFASSFK